MLFLGVGRRGFGFAVQIGIEVGHHGGIGGEQPIEPRSERVGSQRRPVTPASQPHQQVVVPVWELEEVLAHPVPLRVSVTVSLGQFHDAGYDIAGVVIQRLGRTE